MAASSTWREGREDLCRCWCESPWRSPWTACPARDCLALPVSGTQCACPTDPDQSDTNLAKAEKTAILTLHQCACPTDPDQSGTNLANRKNGCNINIRNWVYQTWMYEILQFKGLWKSKSGTVILFKSYLKGHWATRQNSNFLTKMSSSRSN